MNSIVFILSLFTIFIVSGASHFGRHVVLIKPAVVLLNHYPFRFGFKAHEFMDLRFSFNNIPQNVSMIHLVITQSDDQQERIVITNEIEISEIEEVVIKKRLEYRKILIDVELLTKTGLCMKKRVVEGRDIKKLWKWFGPDWVYDYDYNGICLSLQPCVINVDFENKCEDKVNYNRARNKRSFRNTWNSVFNTFKKIDLFNVFGITSDEDQTPTIMKKDSLNCSRNGSQYICMLLNNLENTTHQLFQSYDYKSSIGIIPEIKSSTVKLFMKLELFDNNTSINGASMQNGSHLLQSDKIVIYDGDIIVDNNIATLKYSETTEVQFSCQQYLNETRYIEVGLINTAENRIETFNTVRYIPKMSDNGSVLCCICYYQTFGEAQHIARFVEDKTLLVYEQNQTVADDITEKKIDTGNGSSVNTEKPTSASNNRIVYSIACFVGMFVTIIVVYISIKKLSVCHNNPPPTDTVELETYSSPNEVLYAKLDLRNSGYQPPSQNNESQYSEIIGVLKPYNNK